MRRNYPLISSELNDKFQETYYKLVSILGYDDDDGNSTYIGAFDIIESKIRQVVNDIIIQPDSSNANLVFNSPDGTIELYTLWGKYIIINELRKM